MTTTYDPMDPAYRDEADVRGEMTRVFDVCQGCRRCVDLCSSFPTLFEMIDRHEDRDAGRLTPAQQDRVVDECVQCTRCSLGCPYLPGHHEAAVDFPRLMLRSAAMRHAHGHLPARQRVAKQFLARTDLVGKVATSARPIANRFAAARPRSLIRKLLAAITGVSSARLLSPFAEQRFSAWFAKRPKIFVGRRRGRVTVFPTCLVEYQATGIGRDLVKVFERNGIECECSSAGCCGAPWLHAGDVERFTKVARRNVAKLAAEARRGTDIVVPQPTCGYVLKRYYVEYVGGPDAELVAEHTFDAAEYLMTVHRGDATSLDVDFQGTVPDRIAYHTPCHLRAQEIGFTSRDLMKLTGAKVKLVQQCSGVHSHWGLRAGNDDVAVPVAQRLGEAIVRAEGHVVAGDSHLANTAIAEQTGLVPLHPLQILARAYGIADED